MRLIIGGAFQGKTEYAMRTYALSEEEIADGAEASIEEIYRLPCLKNFHLLTKRILKDGGVPVEVASSILERNPHILILTDEIGNGIVPLEKHDREWRKETGRACCYLAQEAETVTRVVCGISTVIKGAGT